VIARIQNAVAVVEMANQRLIGLEEDALQTNMLTDMSMSAITESMISDMQELLNSFDGIVVLRPGCCGQWFRVVALFSNARGGLAHLWKL
jgi:hypothetical protein